MSSIISFFLASHFKDGIWRIYSSESLKHSWDALTSMLQARQTELESHYHRGSKSVSSSCHMPKWELMKWWQLCPHVSSPRYYYCTFYLAPLLSIMPVCHFHPLTQALNLSVCRRSGRRERSPTRQPSLFFGTWRWTAKLALSAESWSARPSRNHKITSFRHARGWKQWSAVRTYQNCHNPQHHSSHVVFQFPVCQRAVQAMDRVPRGQLRCEHTDKDMTGVLVRNLMTVQISRQVVNISLGLFYYAFRFKLPCSVLNHLSQYTEGSLWTAPVNGSHFISFRSMSASVTQACVSLHQKRSRFPQTALFKSYTSFIYSARCRLLSIKYCFWLQRSN